MSADLASLRAAVSAGQVFRYRFFWGHRPRPDGRIGDSCFSQWWACRFAVGGETFSSAEQFMMAGKARLFGDEDARRRIMAVDDPGAVKQLGREVRGFDAALWEAAREALVTEGNEAKFSQDARLRAHLLATGDDVLVEASPTDAIWGIGLAASDPRAQDPRTWEGLNLLGFALMRARATVRRSSS